MLSNIFQFLSKRKLKWRREGQRKTEAEASKLELGTENGKLLSLIVKNKSQLNVVIIF